MILSRSRSRVPSRRFTTMLRLNIFIICLSLQGVTSKALPSNSRLVITEVDLDTTPEVPEDVPKEKELKKKPPTEAPGFGPGLERDTDDPQGVVHTREMLKSMKPGPGVQYRRTMPVPLEEAKPDLRRRRGLPGNQNVLHVNEAALKQKGHVDGSDRERRLKSPVSRGRSDERRAGHFEMSPKNDNVERNGTKNGVNISQGSGNGGRDCLNKENLEKIASMNSLSVEATGRNERNETRRAGPIGKNCRDQVDKEAAAKGEGVEAFEKQRRIAHLDNHAAELLTEVDGQDGITANVSVGNVVGHVVESTNETEASLGDDLAVKKEIRPLLKGVRESTPTLEVEQDQDISVETVDKAYKGEAQRKLDYRLRKLEDELSATSARWREKRRNLKIAPDSAKLAALSPTNGKTGVQVGIGNDETHVERFKRRSRRRRRKHKLGRRRRSLFDFLRGLIDSVKRKLRRLEGAKKARQKELAIQEHVTNAESNNIGVQKIENYPSELKKTGVKTESEHSPDHTQTYLDDSTRANNGTNTDTRSDDSGDKMSWTTEGDNSENQGTPAERLGYGNNAGTGRDSNDSGIFTSHRREKRRFFYRRRGRGRGRGYYGRRYGRRYGREVANGDGTNDVDKTRDDERSETDKRHGISKHLQNSHDESSLQTKKMELKKQGERRYDTDGHESNDHAKKGLRLSERERKRFKNNLDSSMQDLVEVVASLKKQDGEKGSALDKADSVSRVVRDVGNTAGDNIGEPGNSLIEKGDDDDGEEKDEDEDVYEGDSGDENAPIAEDEAEDVDDDDDDDDDDNEEDDDDDEDDDGDDDDDDDDDGEGDKDLEIISATENVGLQEMNHKLYNLNKPSPFGHKDSVLAKKLRIMKKQMAKSPTLSSSGAGSSLKAGATGAAAGSPEVGKGEGVVRASEDKQGKRKKAGAREKESEWYLNQVKLIRQEKEALKKHAAEIRRRLKGSQVADDIEEDDDNDDEDVYNGDDDNDDDEEDAYNGDDGFDEDDEPYADADTAVKPLNIRKGFEYEGGYDDDVEDEEDELESSISRIENKVDDVRSMIGSGLPERFPPPPPPRHLPRALLRRKRSSPAGDEQKRKASPTPRSGKLAREEEPERLSSTIQSNRVNSTATGLVNEPDRIYQHVSETVLSLKDHNGDQTEPTNDSAGKMFKTDQPKQGRNISAPSQNVKDTMSKPQDVDEADESAKNVLPDDPQTSLIKTDVRDIQRAFIKGEQQPNVDTESFYTINTNSVGVKNNDIDQDNANNGSSMTSDMQSGANSSSYNSVDSQSFRDHSLYKILQMPGVDFNSSIPESTPHNIRVSSYKSPLDNPSLGMGHKYRRLNEKYITGSLGNSDDLDLDGTSSSLNSEYLPGPGGQARLNHESVFQNVNINNVIKVMTADIIHRLKHILHTLRTMSSTTRGSWKPSDVLRKLGTTLGYPNSGPTLPNTLQQWLRMNNLHQLLLGRLELGKIAEKLRRAERLHALRLKALSRQILDKNPLRAAAALITKGFLPSASLHTTGSLSLNQHMKLRNNNGFSVFEKLRLFNPFDKSHFARGFAPTALRKLAMTLSKLKKKAENIERKIRLRILKNSKDILKERALDATKQLGLAKTGSPPLYGNSDARVSSQGQTWASTNLLKQMIGHHQSLPVGVGRGHPYRRQWMRLFLKILRSLCSGRHSRVKRESEEDWSKWMYEEEKEKQAPQQGIKQKRDPITDEEIGMEKELHNLLLRLPMSEAEYALNNDLQREDAKTAAATDVLKTVMVHADDKADDEPLVDSSAAVELLSHGARKRRHVTNVVPVEQQRVERLPPRVESRLAQKPPAKKSLKKPGRAKTRFRVYSRKNKAMSKGAKKGGKKKKNSSKQKKGGRVKVRTLKPKKRPGLKQEVDSLFLPDPTMPTIVEPSRANRGPVKKFPKGSKQHAPLGSMKKTPQPKRFYKRQGDYPAYASMGDVDYFEGDLDEGADNDYDLVDDGLLSGNLLNNPPYGDTEDWDISHSQYDPNIVKKRKKRDTLSKDLKRDALSKDLKRDTLSKDERYDDIDFDDSTVDDAAYEDSNDLEDYEQDDAEPDNDDDDDDEAEEENETYGYLVEDGEGERNFEEKGIQVVDNGKKAEPVEEFAFIAQKKDTSKEPGEPLSWGPWSGCSVTCGLGQRSRVSICAADGEPCHGRQASEEIEVCSVQQKC